MYLLEWLSVKMEDAHAETAADLGIAYLRRHHVPEQFAKEMSHFVLDEIMAAVISVFPDITFLELSRARYVWESPITLAVYVPPAKPITSHAKTDP
jgi:hypothetical protein